MKVISRGPKAGLPAVPVTDSSRHLTRRQIKELLNAEAFAEHLGVGFAAHVTLHWRCGPAFNPASWSTRLGRFLDKLSRWLARNRIPVAFAWVNEVGREYGEHTHLLLHLPKDPRHPTQSFQATKAKLEAWITTTENLAARTDRHGKPWLPVKITGGSFGMRNRKMRSGVCKYLLKGMCPKDIVYTGFGVEPRAAALGIRPRASAKPIHHKRSGTSTRTLGPKVRRADPKWRELSGSIEELHARLNPI